MPSVVFTGVTEKPVALQTVDVIAVTAGRGLTVTVILNAVPIHEPVVGVTEYTILMAALVVLVSVPVILLAAEPDAVPVIPVTIGADQV